MEKLLMLKEWLTLDEAAARFSTTAKESVTQADILRLALDNHLQLSVFIDDKLIAREMEFETEIIDGEKNLMLGDGSSEAVRIDGVWDLAAYGVGAIELERLYRELKGLKSRNGLFSSAGLYLHDEDKTSVMEVLSISLKFKFVDKARHAAKDTTGVSSDSVVESPSLMVNADPSMLVHISKMLKKGLADYEPVIDESIYAYYRETSFPDACLIVIRKDELIAFERKHLGGSIKAELTPTERESSHQIIASLSAMAGIDLGAPYKAVEILRQGAATHGLELPASAETIVKFLAGPNRKKR